MATPCEPNQWQRRSRERCGDGGRDEVAYVICYESIDGEHLIATNVFRHEAGSAGGRAQWRLLHHQAGPTTGEPDDGDEQGPNQPLN